MFTLPHELNCLALWNKALVYKLLFDSVAETLQTFAKKELGGQLGFISVLHTWNQKLQYHIHLHCIIPAGAFTKASAEWIPTRSEKFLFPVRALSKVFRAKFLALLRRHQDKLKLPAHLRNESGLGELLNSVWEKEWVVYAKRPFLGPKAVIEYLGRYTHKTAISNSRIIELASDGKVTLKYRDRSDGDKEKTMSLDAVEFLRRFMLHALPKGFHRIRFYGFLSNVSKNENIDEIYRILRTSRPTRTDPKEITAQSLFLKKFNIDITKYPQCKQGTLNAHKPP